MRLWTTSSLGDAQIQLSNNILKKKLHKSFQIIMYLFVYKPRAKCPQLLSAQSDTELFFNIVIQLWEILLIVIKLSQS
jgi:hypothetical protein